MNANNVLKIVNLLNALNIARFSIDDIVEVSGISIKELSSKSRKRELVEWRTIASVWLYMNEKSTEKVGDFLNIDHSSVSHHFKKFIFCFEERKFRKEFNEKLDDLLTYISYGYKSNQILAGRTEDQHQNELIALALMDNKLNELKA